MVASSLLLLTALQVAAAPGTFTISGRLQMPDGPPAAAVRVVALPAPGPTVRAAEGQNYYATQAPVSVTLSDPDGGYRLTNVRPGRYLVVAGIVGSGTFYPSTTDIDAATIVTLTDRDLERLDFRLLMHPGSRVSGRVTPPPARGAREWATLAGVNLGELLEVAVREDGTFQFGRLPRGEYLLNIFPTPPGQQSLRFVIADRDVTSLEVARPQVQRVTGRVVADNGPVPAALLGFETPYSHVSADIRPDGSFDVSLHAGQHRVDLGGMPVGYRLSSVTVGAAEVGGTGIVVGNRPVADVVIRVSAPSGLPTLRGRVVFPAGTPARAVTLEASGRIVGLLRTEAAPDGSFQFGAMPPGTYQVRVTGDETMTPVSAVVTSSGGEVSIQLRK